VFWEAAGIGRAAARAGVASYPSSDENANDPMAPSPKMRVYLLYHSGKKVGVDQVCGDSENPRWAALRLQRSCTACTTPVMSNTCPNSVPIAESQDTHCHVLIFQLLPIAALLNSF
jgi:hypothetical protein